MRFQIARKKFGTNVRAIRGPPVTRTALHLWWPKASVVRGPNIPIHTYLFTTRPIEKQKV